MLGGVTYDKDGKIIGKAWFKKKLLGSHFLKMIGNMIYITGEESLKKDHREVSQIRS